MDAEDSQSDDSYVDPLEERVELLIKASEEQRGALLEIWQKLSSILEILTSSTLPTR